MTGDSKDGLIIDAAEEHALRNHLAIIIGYCDVLMRETPLADAVRADLEEIEQAATAALTVITNARD